MISQGYLFGFSPGGKEVVCHVSRNQNHGGESHEPADPLTPRREHIVIHFERNHLDSAKQKHSLKKRRRLGGVWESRLSLSWFIFQPVFLQLKTHRRTKKGFKRYQLLENLVLNVRFVYGSNHYASPWSEAVPELQLLKPMRKWMWYCTDIV